jgi:hypothetical protein
MRNSLVMCVLSEVLNGDAEIDVYMHCIPMLAFSITIPLESPLADAKIPLLEIQ